VKSIPEVLILIRTLGIDLVTVLANELMQNVNIIHVTAISSADFFFIASPDVLLAIKKIFQNKYHHAFFSADRAYPSIMHIFIVD